MQLKDCVAIITGAGKGIGKGIAEEFYEEGARLALFDLRYDLIRNISKELKVDSPAPLNITSEAPSINPSCPELFVQSPPT